MWIFVKLSAKAKEESPLQVSYEYPPGYKMPKYKNPYNKYGFFHGCFDFMLVIFTGGLWLIWILIKYLRSNSR